MILELQRAKRVCDLFKRITLAVGKIIAWIDAPFVAHTVMVHAFSTIHHWVAHIHVRMRHIDLGAQYFLTIGKLARTHAFEEIYILCDRTLAKRASTARLGNRATVVTHLVKRKLLDIRVSLLDQLDGPLKQLLKIITGEANLRPFKA